MGIMLTHRMMSAMGHDLWIIGHNNAVAEELANTRGTANVWMAIVPKR
jgi:hypothetical protein